VSERRHSLVPGAVLLALGFVFALDRFAGLKFWDVWQWGLVLGGLVVFLFDRWDPRGLLVAIVGLVLWGAEFYDLRFRYVWPLIIMGLGVFLIVRQLARRAQDRRQDGISRSSRPTPPVQ
jgi:hypothetical protein